jgi:phosphatidylglycerol:prolipoprotein diacylglycerol transferase
MNSDPIFAAAGWQLPYFPQPELSVGPFTFHAFGALVGLAVLVGLRHGIHLARQRNLPPSLVRNVIFAALVPGFLGAAVLDTLFYHPESIQSEGFWMLFNVADGMSSVGGFLGATVGILICLKLMGQPRLVVGDTCVRALIMSWPVARLACTFAHDHQGRLTDFPFAFAYPDGARHNLGFYECCYALLVLVPLVIWLERRPWYRPGMTMAIAMIFYGPARIILDSLRSIDQVNSDLRFWGWTFAQIISLVMVAGGSFLLLIVQSDARRKPPSTR